MNIKEIAQKLAQDYWKRDQWNIEYFDCVGFAEALIAEVAKQNKPVESQYKGSDGSWKSFDSKDHESNTRNSGDWEVRDLFAFPPTSEQIANETAEAIAKMVEFEEAIRSGARKENCDEH